ncbi:interferon regulatory factor 7 isoform X1 [Cynoglossus semilaevis]|uniref:interferon regulatory factor 7 isoform X1 n=1 Tax=Cynoglossus semilaevis TaxID=244447 RepID=UPI0007DC982A|nr:interferon regulatory factor 7 isoform X1 [Cynoglossus semilaevis]
MQSPPKPQFASWLLRQLETGQYSGLCYVGHNRFRVPWKHNSRKDCRDEDCEIFRAWAVASGKINEFPNDKARWKTNFRCALNNLSVRFKKVEDNSKNSDDPHKIYEITNANGRQEVLPNEKAPEDLMATLDIYSSPTEYFPTGAEPYLVHNFTALDLENQPAEEPQWADNYCQPNPAVIECYPAAAEIHPPAAPQQQSYCEAIQPTIRDLEISIFYRKKEMLKTTVRTSRLQLHYQHQDPNLNDTYHLCFPTTDGLLDHKQIDFTNKILSSIQRGLLLEVQETGIYAWRQDRCHVFASTSDPSVAHPNPRKLPQNTVEELLNFETFVKELKSFKENNGSSPRYTINMCFGEKFPDGKPLEKKLIVVKVVPLICQYFHELAQMEGASSLHSTNVSLQISHNSLYDLINSAFELPAPDETVQAFLH